MRGIELRFVWVALAGLLCLSACVGGPDPTATPTPPRAVVSPVVAPTPVPGGLTLFVASSLKEAITEAGQSFKAAHPPVTEVQYNFAGSAALAGQLQQGARADVFLSADKANMDKAVAAGVIAGPVRELARNVLVVVLPEENFGQVATLADLARPGLKIALADPGVPVGNYTMQALDKLAADPAYGADFKQQVLGNVVSRDDNVRQVLTRIQLGEVDAGIVYATDARAANATANAATQPVKTLAIPEPFNVVAVYYIAAVKDAPAPATGQHWIAYILSDIGQATLEKYGFMRAAQP
jgi:molybdate transport system substrate-binding protein